jgi:hypothetical protein
VLRLVAISLVWVFVSTVAAGYYLGRARSIKFNDATRAPKFIRDYVGQRVTKSDSGRFLKTRDQNGLSSLRPAGLFSFSCGVTTFSYDEEQRKVNEIPYLPGSGPEQPRPPRNNLVFSDTMVLFFGGAGVYSLKETGTKVSETYSETRGGGRASYVVAAVSVAAIGTAVGFWLGYVDQPECGAELFQKLLRDPVFWEGLVEVKLASDPSDEWAFSRDRGFILVSRQVPPRTEIVKKCIPTIESVFDSSCKEYEANFSLWAERATAQEFSTIGESSGVYANCDDSREIQSMTCTFVVAPPSLRSDLERSGEVALLKTIDQQAGRVLQ